MYCLLLLLFPAAAFCVQADGYPIGLHHSRASHHHQRVHSHGKLCVSTVWLNPKWTVFMLTSLHVYNLYHFLFHRKGNTRINAIVHRFTLLRAMSNRFFRKILCLLNEMHLLHAEHCYFDGGVILLFINRCCTLVVFAHYFIEKFYLVTKVVDFSRSFLIGQIPKRPALKGFSIT